MQRMKTQRVMYNRKPVPVWLDRYYKYKKEHIKIENSDDHITKINRENQEEKKLKRRDTMVKKGQPYSPFERRKERRSIFGVIFFILLYLSIQKIV